MSDEGRVVLQRSEYTVRMADVDAASVIYFASPLRWQEMLVSEWYIRCGHSLSDQLARGTCCPVAEVRVTYHRPLRLDDPLTLELAVERTGRTSFGLSMTGTTPTGEVAVRVHTTNVWTESGSDGNARPMPLPDWLEAALLGRFPS